MDFGAHTCATKRTSALSTPIPNAMVPTITWIGKERKYESVYCSVSKGNKVVTGRTNS
jgi:hypothetical protein